MPTIFFFDEYDILYYESIDGLCNEIINRIENVSLFRSQKIV